MSNERPVLFNTKMVNAILSGQKTQTRRPVKEGQVRCPYGVAGDRLWVRETWQMVHPLAAEGRFSKPCTAGIPGPPPVPYRLVYRADGEYRAVYRQGSLPYPYAQLVPSNGYAVEHTGWRPSIHMPREASRLDLAVLNIEKQNLQSITEK